MNLSLRQTDAQTQRTYLWLLNGRWEEGMDLKFEINIYTLLYIK